MGPRQFIADQLLAKTDVIRAMHERVQLCQDPQTEFAFLRESLGASRINRTLQVDGHTILQEQRAAEIYDEIGQETLAVSATDPIVDNKHSRPLLLQKRRRRLTEENCRKVLVPGDKVFWKERPESVQKNPQRKVYGSVV